MKAVCAPGSLDRSGDAPMERCGWRYLSFAARNMRCVARPGPKPGRSGDGACRPGACLAPLGAGPVAPARAPDFEGRSRTIRNGEHSKARRFRVLQQACNAKGRSMPVCADSAREWPASIKSGVAARADPSRPRGGTGTGSAANPDARGAGAGSPRAAGRKTTRAPKGPCCSYLAERGGFEPPVRYKRTPDFESGTFNHSATSPGAVSRE